MKLLFATLFSGSSGNAVYISCGDEAILIDAGKNCRALERAAAVLGENLQKVRAVFVTHEHSDHISALPVFCRRYGVPVYVPLACAEAVGELPPTAVPYEGLCDQTVGNFHVTGFRTPHDSAGSMGYLVEAGGRKFGVATDMGMLAKSVVAALTGCNAALIECNYDTGMLDSGVYPPSLKTRIKGKGGHLSNEDGALLAAVLAYTGTSHILLGHLSRENNTPEKALSAVQKEFAHRGVQAELRVAFREEPTVLWEEEKGS